MAADTFSPDSFSRPARRVPARRRSLPRGGRTPLIVAVLGLCAVAIFIAVLERIGYDAEVLPGINVAGIDAGGMTESELTTKLELLAGRLETRTFSATVGSVKVAAAAEALGYQVDIAATVRAARIAGRSGNPLAAALGVVARRVSDHNVGLVHRIDHDAVTNTANRWAREVNQQVRNASIEIVGEAVRIVEPVAALGIDPADVRAALLRASDSMQRNPVINFRQRLVQPMVDRAQAELVAADARRTLAGNYTVRSGAERFVIAGKQLVSSLQATATGRSLRLTINDKQFRAALSPSLQKLAQPPIDARFRVNPDDTVSVVGGKAGRGPDLRRVAQAILAGTREIDAPSVTVAPLHDTQWATSLGITQRVASFTSHHPCCAARVTNIHVAATLLNGAVIEPGTLFSLNDIVGPRTEARGFVSAPVFYGEFNEDFGGGVSQLATTTYNAAFWGGFEIVVHKPHTIYFDRYPMGREATVNYPSLDLKWRNDTSHGVLVTTSFSNTGLTVSLYGNNEGRSVRETTKDCSVGPITDTRNDPRCINVLETIDKVISEVSCPTASFADDPKNLCATLKPGQRVAGPAGHIGYYVEFFRTIRQSNRPPRVERYTWRYRMLPDIFLNAPVGPNTTTTSNPAAGVATTTTPGPTPTTNSPSPTTTTSATTPGL